MTDVIGRDWDQKMRQYEAVVEPVKYVSKQYSVMLSFHFVVTERIAEQWAGTQGWNYFLCPRMKFNSRKCGTFTYIILKKKVIYSGKSDL